MDADVDNVGRRKTSQEQHKCAFGGPETSGMSMGEAMTTVVLPLGLLDHGCVAVMMSTRATVAGRGTEAMDTSVAIEGEGTLNAACDRRPSAVGGQCCAAAARVCP